MVRCYIQFRKELRTHVYQHDQPSLITLPAPTQQSIAQSRKKTREKIGTKLYCPLDKERAISKTGIGASFFIVALTFVYRSFYAMRIPAEDTAGNNNTRVIPQDVHHEELAIDER